MAQIRAKRFGNRLNAIQRRAYASRLTRHPLKAKLTSHPNTGGTFTQRSLTMKQRKEMFGKAIKTR